jgi:hexokinase
MVASESLHQPRLSYRARMALLAQALYRLRRHVLFIYFRLLQRLRALFGAPTARSTSTADTTATMSISGLDPRFRPPFGPDPFAVQKQEFLSSVRAQMTAPLAPATLLAAAHSLSQQYADHCTRQTPTMLPSFLSAGPSGAEAGQVLAVDVGGSTLRIAAVRLDGRASPQLLGLRTWPIGDEVKQMPGRSFFDWLAERIEHALDLEPVLGCMRERMAMGSKGASPVGGAVPGCPGLGGEGTIPMALAWSFPLEYVADHISLPPDALIGRRQTALNRGSIQSMGKGFVSSGGLFGQDLHDLITEALRKRVRQPSRIGTIAHGRT